MPANNIHNTELSFRKLKADDWPHVAKIYQQGIDTGQATFETLVPNWQQWDQGHLSLCRIIAELGSTIVGWAALSPVSKREVYRGVAEVSVYVSPDHFGQKIGTQLLNRLIMESEQDGIWMLLASIFRENPSSIHIHKKLGFREVGYREKIGKMNGIWRNTVLLERRSSITGID